MKSPTIHRSIAAQLLGLILVLGQFVSTTFAQGPSWSTAVPSIHPPAGGWRAPAASNVRALAAAAAFTFASPDAVTPDLQALADSLGNDPLRIYAYVKNRIKFEPYFECRRGSRATYLDGYGSDFDQCALLVALLKASGFSTDGSGAKSVQYVLGTMKMPIADASGKDLRAWLGGDAACVDTSLDFGLFRRNHLPAEGAYEVDRIWVEAKINGVTSILDPGYKRKTRTAGINLDTAMGFDTAALEAAVGGNTTAWTELNAANLSTKLTAFSTTLSNGLKTVYKDSSFADIFPTWQIIPETISVLPTTPTFPVIVDSTRNIETIRVGSIPDGPHMLKLRITAGLPSDSTPQMDVTVPTASLHGGKLFLRAADSTAKMQLWLDDAMIAEESSGGTFTSSCAVTVTPNHTDPKFNNPDTFTIKTRRLLRSPLPSLPNCAVFLIGLGDSGDSKLIADRTERLGMYRRDTYSDVSASVRSESQYLIALNWMRQASLAIRNVEGLTNTTNLLMHTIGQVIQQEATVLDIPLHFVGPHKLAGGPFGDPLNNLNLVAFRAMGPFFSGAESACLEQNLGAAASSTVDVIGKANAAGTVIRHLSSANVTAANTLNVTLTGYPAGDIGTIIGWLRNQPTHFAVVPASGAVVFGSWKGPGYLLYDTAFPGTHAYRIGGGYSGGYFSLPGNIDPTTLTYYNLPEISHREPSGWDNPASDEPVDLRTGDYLVDETDLSIGAELPRGITLTRHYNSRRRFSVGPFGYGWTHNFDGRVTETTDMGVMYGKRTPAEAASMIVAARAAVYFLQNPTAARPWVAGMLCARWGYKQATDSSASVEIGTTGTQFIRLPDGTYNPPPGVTSVLTKTSGIFKLQPRFSGAITFDSKNRLSTIKDADAATLTVAYRTTAPGTGQIASVTSSEAQVVTFTYYTDTEPVITKVTDTNDAVDRTVNYGYAGTDLVQVTDPESKVWRYEYGTRTTGFPDPATMHRNSLILRQFDADNRQLAENIYDPLGRVVEQQSEGLAAHTWKFRYSENETVQEDPAGFKTTYTYDERGRQIRETDALGLFSQTFYDNQDHIVRQIDKNGAESRYEFDANHNLTKTTDPLLQETKMQYDVKHHLTKIIDPQLFETKFTHSSEHHLLTRTEPSGRVTTHTYTTGGLRASTKDPEGFIARWTYDTHGFPATMTRPDASVVTYDYDTRGNLLSVKDSLLRITKNTYDKRRLLITETDALVGVVTHGYDNSGNETSVTDRDGRTITSAYNALRKKTSMSDARLKTTTYHYTVQDWLERERDPLQHDSWLLYDAAGRQTGAKDALSHIWNTAYYNDGTVLSTTTPLTKKTEIIRDDLKRATIRKNPLLQEVEQHYDAAGRRDWLENQSNRRFNFKYDNDGRQTELKTPLNYVQKTAYNLRGLPTLLTEPSLQTTAFTYDSVGRMKTKVDAVGTQTVTYDKESNPLTVVENAKTITRTYDALNRLKTFKDEASNTISYDYTAEGDLKTLTYPDGKKVNYTYNANHQLETVTDWNNRGTLYTYDDAGRLRRIDRPNGTSQIADYDDADRLKKLQEVGPGGAVIATFDQAYFDDNKLQTTTPTRHSPTVVAPTPPALHATFDVDNRMETFNGVSTQFDADGNMTFGPLGKPAIGNVIPAGSIHAYDARNRLIAAGGVTYSYDSEGRRTGMTDASGLTKFVNDPNATLDRVLWKVAPGGTTTRYVYGIGLLYEETNAATLTYHYDWRDSTVALTDMNGNITGSASYTAYGVVKTFGTINTPFLFNGRWGVQTDANGLLYMRARYYNPLICRFINADPAGFSGGLNWYAYAAGNPVDLLDPFGLGPMAGFFKGLGKGFIKGIIAAAIMALIPPPIAAAIAVVGVVFGLVEWAESGFKITAEGLGEAIGGGIGGGIGGRLVGGFRSGGGGGGYCFPPGTLVLMANGSKKAIEQIIEGDEVLADDPLDGLLPAPKRVTRIHENWTERLIKVSIDADGNGTSDGELDATGEHPFWTANRGWANAVDLKKADLLISPSGSSVRVVSAESRSQTAATFNLSVESSSTFYAMAGDTPVLVHNTNPGLKMHIVYQGLVEPGKFYTGIASMDYFEGITEKDVLRYRIGDGHHRGVTLENATIRESIVGKTRAYNAIRGAEHLYWERATELGQAVRQNSPIGEANPNAGKYLRAAQRIGLTPCP